MSVEHQSRAHSVYGASSSSRWLNCPGSIKLGKDIPDPAPSVAAIEGTCAHEVADICLTKKCDANLLIGEEINGFVVTEEMAAHVQTYLDYIWEALSPGMTLSVEERFELDHIHPELFGTNDACIYEEFGTLHVIDFKYGIGHAVEAENNPQLLYYAVGAMKNRDFTDVKLTIVQPRAFHEKGPIRTWFVKPETVVEFGKILKAGVAACMSKNPKLQIGSWCKFCKAQAICPEQRNKLKEITLSELDKSPLPPADTLTTKQLANVMAHKKMIESFLKEVEEYTTKILEDGGEIEGLKLVRTRSSREWLAGSERDLFERFGKDIFEPKKILSPAKLEKVVGKDDLKPYIVTKQGRKIAVPESDNRRAIT